MLQPLVVRLKTVLISLLSNEVLCLQVPPNTLSVSCEISQSTHCTARWLHTDWRLEQTSEALQRRNMNDNSQVGERRWFLIFFFFAFLNNSLRRSYRGSVQECMYDYVFRFFSVKGRVCKCHFTLSDLYFNIMDC